MPAEDIEKDRRELFRVVGRSLAAVGLAGVSGWLVSRKRVRLSGQTCTNRGICRGCGAFDECGLPAALSAKESLRRET